jgi:hypothetical protein
MRLHSIFLAALAFIFVAGVAYTVYLQPRGRKTETGSHASDRNRNEERIRRARDVAVSPAELLAGADSVWAWTA